MNGTMNGGGGTPAQSTVTFAGGGMAMAGAKPNNLQFGFPSPAMAMTTPHAPHDAAPSPQMPPSPIPQPSRSGGPAMVSGNLGPNNGRPQFGLIGDDHHAQGRPGFTPQQVHASLTAPPHGHPSPQTDLSTMQGGGHRNFGNNRRGNSFNSGHNHNHGSPRFTPAMHYNPNHSFQPGPPRGGMGTTFTPSRPAFNPARSPAMPPSMPVTTPNMGQANLMPMNPGQPHYYTGVGHHNGMPPVQQSAGYPPYMTHSYYPPAGYAAAAPFQPQYHGSQPHFQPAVTHNMSRTSSHSERPTSSASNQQQAQQQTQQVQQPAVVSSQPPQAMGMPPSTPSSANFVRAKRTSAITIKDAQGKPIDLSTVVTPAPAAAATAAATASTTGDSTAAASVAKSSAPAPHARTDSAKIKTTEEIQLELRQKIGMMVGKVKVEDQAPKEEPKDTKPEDPKEEVKEAKAESKEEAAAPKAEEVKVADEPKEAPKQVAKEEPAEVAKEEPAEVAKEEPAEVAKEEPAEVAKEEPPKAEVAKEEPKAAEPAVEEKPKETPAEEPKAESKVEPKAEPAVPEAAEAKKEEAPADDEDEMERMIREMEEADAAREKAEEEHRVKKEAEKKAAKEREEAARKINAAEEDRKLEEAEREMERLEDEKARKRNAREAGGATTSFAEMLAKARSGELPAEEEPEKTEAAPAASTSDSLNPADTKPLDGHKATAQRAAKPAALNLKTANTGAVEPPQPSAALQSLRSARFLTVMDQNLYPSGIHSPNPALNAAVTNKGRTFRYDAGFLLQFQKVFVEQPSVEFGQQVKALIGDGESRSGAAKGGSSSYSRTNSRSGPGAGSNIVPMGGIGMMGSRNPAAAGMGSSHIRPGASGSGPFGGSFGSGKPFGSSGMSRNPSSANVLPHSPSGRQASRQGTRGRGGKGEDSKKMAPPPSSLGPDVKPLLPSGSGWKPLSVGSASARGGPSASAVNGHLDPEMVQRKVKAALNKMTPEKFDKISTQILEIAAQSKNETDGRTLRQVIQLTFEKATDEAHWASMYAQFCRRMLDQMDASVRDEGIRDKNDNVVSGGALFRKYLLNRCQEDFERGWTVKLPPKPEEENEGAGKPKNGEAEILSDEYYIAAAAKRRGLGLVQFIGELFKLQMLTERIMHECVRKLVDFQGMPDEAEVESLSKLLQTIGANLDASEKGRPVMDVYFERIKMMIEIKDLPSRLKFMLMDVIDLRNANWVSKDTNKGPKTLDEVRIDAEAAQAAKAQESARSNVRGGGRAPMGRQDARGGFPGAPPHQPNPALVSTNDLNRLKMVNRTSGSGFGNSTMFASRNPSGRKPFFGSSSRHGEDSSRAGTPGGQAGNSFDILSQLDGDNPGSPPSVNASPALVKATPAPSPEKKSDKPEKSEKPEE